jgi:hypothetical protein
VGINNELLSKLGIFCASFGCLRNPFRSRRTLQTTEKISPTKSPEWRPLKTKLDSIAAGDVSSIVTSSRKKSF